MALLYVLNPVTNSSRLCPAIESCNLHYLLAADLEEEEEEEGGVMGDEGDTDSEFEDDEDIPSPAHPTRTEDIGTKRRAAQVRLPW